MFWGHVFNRVEEEVINAQISEYLMVHDIPHALAPGRNCSNASYDVFQEFIRIFRKDDDRECCLCSNSDENDTTKIRFSLLIFKISTFNHLDILLFPNMRFDSW